jgi:hypothetical protein
MDLELVKRRSITLIKEMQIKTNIDTNVHPSDWQRSKTGESATLMDGTDCYHLLGRTLLMFPNITNERAFTRDPTSRNLYCRQTLLCAKWHEYKGAHGTAARNGQNLEAASESTIAGSALISYTSSIK